MRRYGSQKITGSLDARFLAVYCILGLLLTIVVARLLELQVVRHKEYTELAQNQHFGGIVLQAKRGEILALDSKTGETSILATNTTLDMVYIDPLVTDDPAYTAETLGDVLITQFVHDDCAAGKRTCPRELQKFYSVVFDPLRHVALLHTGTLLEPLAGGLSALPVLEAPPDLTEVRRLFARDIERKIEKKRVEFVPLLYGANKQQMEEIRSMSIDGITVMEDTRLVYGNPEEIDHQRLARSASRLAEVLEKDERDIRFSLRQRSLRYVPIMRKLSPTLSSRIRELKSKSALQTIERRKNAPSAEDARRVSDPLRSIALLPEHWRFYPEGSVAAHIVGFLNASQEAQYGIERTFNPQLKGKEGLISSLSDTQGGHVLSDQQTIVEAQDGDTVVLTIDRNIQQRVEHILYRALKEYAADSAQAIVMEPKTGRILAMANVPLFDSNDYGVVYAREPMLLTEEERKGIVVELYHPETNAFVLKAYIDDVFTASGRNLLSENLLGKLTNIEKLYELEDISRYYLYVGENSRWEVFPTDKDDVWLGYKNHIGVGAYLNRSLQEIYEPGSVLKAITIAVAIDEGEILPEDTYLDEEPVEVDEYTITNAQDAYYGEVTMTNCLEFSINTCMTTVSTKLGKKLFHRSLERFGFGKVTGIELEDDLPGEIKPWRKWSNSLLATASYGQGISATPLQLITAFSALANGGKLMKPTIVHSIVRSDGTVVQKQPRVLDQVITPQTAQTITAMLVSTVRNGFAKTARVWGYHLAGKTGTSQIAGPGGRYETGTGSTITSFAGYGPAHDPQFVILVKFDRPRTRQFGSRSAAPVFKEIAAFLLTYYGIPPDDV